MHELSLVADAAASSSLQATVAAGAVSKLARDVLLYPLDVAKIRGQALPSACADEVTTSFSAGILPVLLSSVPSGAAYFGLNAFVLEQLAPLHGSATVALAAAVAAVGFWFILTPSELLKTRAVTAPAGSRTSAVARVAEILHTEGVAGMFTGFGATVARSVPFEIIRLSLYPMVLAAVVAGTDASVDGASGAVAGAAASMSAALLTQPLDTIKTALQLERDDDGPPKAPLPRLASAAASIFAEGGVASFYRGTIARCGSVGLAGSIKFGVYQAALPTLERLIVQL